jgi:hypothetical protein
MDPAEFHAFAVATLRNKRPVDCRVAIGRAYYAVFNVAAQLLRRGGCKIDDGPQGHGQAFNFLLNVASNPDVVDAGSWMRDTRSSRNKADYKLDDVTVEHFLTAELIVTEAGSHIEALRVAFREPSLPGIIADLNIYKQKMQAGSR